MTQFDICSNSIFIQKKQKKELNNKINTYFNKISNDLSQVKMPINLYFTGSLARKEPCICINYDSSVSLASDIDFVVVLKKGHKKNIFLNNMTKYLNEKYPEFINSVGVISEENLLGVKSFFGRDLCYSITFPVYKTFEITSFSFVPPSKRNCFEVLINQIGGYFLHPEMTNKHSNFVTFMGLEYHYTKLILESLRAQFFDNNNMGYYSLAEKCSDIKLNNILQPKKILDVLYARELSEYDGLHDLNVIEIVVNSLLVHLDIYDGNNSTSYILGKIKNLVSKDDSFIILFQYLMVILVLSLRNDIYYKQCLLFFIDIIKMIDKNVIIICKDFAKLEHINSDLPLISGTKQYDLIIDILRELRYDYLRLIHAQNIGEKE